MYGFLAGGGGGGRCGGGLVELTVVGLVVVAISVTSGGVGSSGSTISSSEVNDGGASLSERGAGGSGRTDDSPSSCGVGTEGIVSSVALDTILPLQIAPAPSAESSSG